MGLMVLKKKKQKMINDCINDINMFRKATEILTEKEMIIQKISEEIINKHLNISS